MLTLVFKAFRLFGQQFDLLLLPLTQHLPLEASHRAQQLVASHLRRRQHDAAVQEAVDGVQQVLPVVRQVGCLVELLDGNSATNISNTQEMFSSILLSLTFRPAASLPGNHPFYWDCF